MCIHYNYITNKSPETKKMNLKYNCLQNHRNWSLEFSHSARKTHKNHMYSAILRILQQLVIRNKSIIVYHNGTYKKLLQHILPFMLGGRNNHRSRIITLCFFIYASMETSPSYMMNYLKISAFPR